MSQLFSDDLPREFYGDMSRPDIYWGRRALLQAVRQAAPLFRGTLLDLGCGRQPYRSFLEKESLQGIRYVGMDLADCIHGKPDHVWDGQTIPLPDASVDGVLATELFEHCPRPWEIFSEIHRVLKEDGLLVFTVPFVWPLHEVPHDEFRYTPFSLRRLFAEAGFKDIHIRALNGWHGSMAEMLGLWLVRSPLSPQDRQMFFSQLHPLWKRLIEIDVPPDRFEESTMTSRWSGVVFKSAPRSRPFLPSRPAPHRLAVFRAVESAGEQEVGDADLDLLAEGRTILFGKPYPLLLKPGEAIVSAELLGGMAHKRPEEQQAFIGKALSAYLRRAEAKAVLVESAQLAASLLPLAHVPGVRLTVRLRDEEALSPALLQMFRGPTEAVLVVSSAWAKRRLVGEGVASDRVHVVPPWVAVSDGEVAVPARNAAVLMAAGPLSPDCLFPELLAAFAQASRNIPEATLIVVGSGPSLAAWQQEADRLGLAGKVRFIGSHSRAAVLRLMALSRAFVEPAGIGPGIEGGGIPEGLLEAAAMGLPLIAVRQGAIPEVVPAGCGLLADPGNVGQMAEHMESLLRDGGKAAALGAAARAHAERNFSREGFLANLRRSLFGEEKGT